jgi:hypothetical protein
VLRPGRVLAKYSFAQRNEIVEPLPSSIVGCEFLDFAKFLSQLLRAYKPVHLIFFFGFVRFRESLVFEEGTRWLVRLVQYQLLPSLLYSQNHHPPE